MCATASSLDDPVQCGRCGHVAERRWLAGETYLAVSLIGTRHLARPDCEPDEYVSVCPVCGAEEAFQDAITCAECLGYPCACWGAGQPPDGWPGRNRSSVRG